MLVRSKKEVCTPRTLGFGRFLKKVWADGQHLFPKDLVSLYEFLHILHVLSRCTTLSGLNRDRLNREFGG